MTAPFPGMDPYLEAPSIWPDVHNRLMFAICDQIQPLLSPHYIAILTPYITYEAIDIATTRVIVPDVGVIEQQAGSYEQTAVAIAPAPLSGLIEVPTRYHRIEIRTVRDEHLVTVIEVLSPANKRAGVDAADAYECKHRDILQSSVHLLEIDLLRGGRRPTLVTSLPAAPYFIMLSRVERRPQVDIWPVSLSEALPIVPLPLGEGDADILLNLTHTLQHIYTSARYDLRIDYRADPPPLALAPEDRSRLSQHLQAAGVR